jgi:hypothetical protein
VYYDDLGLLTRNLGGRFDTFTVGAEQFQSDSRSPNEKDCSAADVPVRKYCATYGE